MRRLDFRAPEQQAIKQRTRPGLGIFSEARPPLAMRVLSLRSAASLKK